jgi:hypothetical protein
VSVIRVHWPTRPQRPGGGTVYLDPSADAEPPVAAPDLPAPVGRPRTADATTPEDPMSAERVSKPFEPPPSATDPQKTSEGADGAVVSQQSPSGRLRLAADRIEQTAAAATRGPWRTNDVEGIFYVASARSGPVTMDNDNPVCVCDYDYEGVAIERDEAEGGRADGEWMALANPQFAPPLVAWLRAEADRVSGPTAVLFGGVRRPPDPHAAALADVILGGGA